MEITKETIYETLKQNKTLLGNDEPDEKLLPLPPNE